MNYFLKNNHTTDMKKLAIFLLTVFTMGTAVACGCSKTSQSSNDKIGAESVQMQTIDKTADNNGFERELFVDECPDGECPKKECPDGECPKPRRPHKRPDKRLPRPESAYRKH